MYKYELLLVMGPDYGVDEKKKVTELAKKLLGDTVLLGDVTPLGKKPFAYPVRKYNEGVYYKVEFSGAPIKVGDVEQKVKMGQKDVIRYLLTRNIYVK